MIKYIKCFVILLVVLVIIPNFSNATTEYTYSDNEQGIEWGYEIDSNGNIINLKCKTKSVTGTIVIPSKIEGKNVITLKGGFDGAFQDCEGLTGITIPNTITTIGRNAFYNCVGLTSVTIPDSVTIIENYAFDNCSGMTSINLSQNLTSIGIGAFLNCTGIKSLTIPNSVTSIGENAFRQCRGLKEVTFSENLTKIADRSFEGCSELTSVVLPNSITTIEGNQKNIYGAFGDCNKLAKILIPDTVASIGVGAFQGCDKLTIYGNDGMKSKEYAEEKGIPFDYIANWNKNNPGADITAPTVEKIELAYSSVKDYNKDTNKNMYIVPTGAKLDINVNFSEVIEATELPTLTIKFGDGSNIKLTEGTIGDSVITYSYNVKNVDKGIMALVSFTGGDIKDTVGNSATLSCPALTIQYRYEEFVYANGDGALINPPSNDGSSENENGSEVTIGGKNDETIATGKLPNAGATIAISIVLISLIVIMIYYYARYKNIKKIKF